MQNHPNRDAIRLTNRTAIALRASARRVQRLYAVSAIVLTVLLTGLAVYLGLRNLIAVPLMVALAVVLDAAIYVISRAHYLSLTGQAICTEAAARQMRESRQEERRRRQALSDLRKMKEDAQMLAKAGLEQIEEQGAKAQERDDAPSGEPAENNGLPKRRRRQAAFQVIRSEQAK